ncbi:MAG: outer membrane protein assembly factor BamE [Pseudomonadales bacterium]
MQKITTIALTLVLTSILSACSQFPGVYKIDIEQGNVVTQEMVDQLQPGMSRSQVRYILGTPQIQDTFHQERWDYYYKMNKAGKPGLDERLTIFFENDVMTSFEGDWVPSSANNPMYQ